MLTSKWLFASLLFLGCGGDQAATRSTTPAASATTASAPEVTVGPDPVADRWQTAPEDEYLKPADCPAFRKVPTRIDTSTMVEGPCIEIPPGAVVTIAQDKSLVILATRKLRIGDGAKIVGRGMTGAPGAAAATTTKEWVPSGPDQSEKINCACRNVRCKPGWQTCNAENDPELRGGRGGTGKRGADVYIVARELLVGSEVRVDLSGGLGGEAGASGHVDCHYGAMQCSVTATSEGDGAGGPDGTLTLNAALPTALASMIAIERFATPPSAVNKHVVDTMAPFRRAVQEAKTRGASFEITPGL